MHDDRRSAQRHEVSGAIVFYRREQEEVEKEHLGILENIGLGGLLLATHEELPTGTLLLMRIYSQVGPPGHSEVKVRGTVQRPSEHPKGVGIRFLETSAHDREGLQGLIATLSSAHHPELAGALV
ncbi:MAG: PilZ domain-containing protein [Acidobacteria bacterium]|nr:PilZ domain-containing protein [Acidobacteriota bacterium]